MFQTPFVFPLFWPRISHFSKGPTQLALKLFKDDKVWSKLSEGGWKKVPLAPNGMKLTLGTTHLNKVVMQQGALV